MTKRCEFVFRLQFDQGAGAYHSEHAQSHFGDPRRNPGPNGDKLPNGKTLGSCDIDKRRFGFAHIEQMRRWFWNKYGLTQMDREGCKLVVYRVAHVSDLIVAEKQAVFTPKQPPILELPVKCVHSISLRRIRKLAKGVLYGQTSR